MAKVIGTEIIITIIPANSSPINPLLTATYVKNVLKNRLGAKVSGNLIIVTTLTLDLNVYIVVKKYEQNALIIKETT